MKPLFGKRYTGIYQYQSLADLPTLKEGQIALLNKATHWTAIFKKHSKLYEIDSYNRDMLGPKYQDNNVPKYFKQPMTTADCGQRTITELVHEFHAEGKLNKLM